MSAYKYRIQEFEEAAKYAKEMISGRLNPVIYEYKGAWKVVVLRKMFLNRIERLRYLDREFRYQPRQIVAKQKTTKEVSVGKHLQ